mgnify:CR=1 FL=1
MKKRILLDTDILVDFFHHQKYAKELIAELQAQGSVRISILSIAELRAGFTSKQAKFFLPKLYDTVVIINVNVEIAELAGEFRFEYGSKGKSLSTVDTLIAATAILEDCQLVTRNKKDFPMPQLKLHQF